MRGFNQAKCSEIRWLIQKLTSYTWGQNLTGSECKKVGVEPTCTAVMVSTLSPFLCRDPDPAEYTWFLSDTRPFSFVCTSGQYLTLIAWSGAPWLTGSNLPPNPLYQGQYKFASRLRLMFSTAILNRLKIRIDLVFAYAVAPTWVLSWLAFVALGYANWRNQEYTPSNQEISIS